MSLYGHVRDEYDLLSAMVDAAFAMWHVPPPRAGDGWQEVLAKAALELWQIFRRHPWLAPAYAERISQDERALGTPQIKTVAMRLT